MTPVPFSAQTAALLLAASSLVGQTASVSPRSGYGTDDLQVITLSHMAFLPLNSAATYFSVCCANDSYRHPTSGASGFFAPLDASLIPNGARIEQIDFYVRDSTAAANADMGGYLCRSWTDLDGADRSGDCSVNAATSGSPGDTVITLTPNFEVLYNTDVDNDGATEAVNYVLSAQFGLNGQPDYSTNLRLRGARILFRRQVSPAPQTATFADVPTSHPFFRYVEALADSGITAGCGAGNYCPDAALTRGQMAVFVAKALGLHWPAPAPPPQ